MALSVGFRVSVSLDPATQVTGLRLLPRWDCLPLSVPAFPGRTGLLSVLSRYGLHACQVTYVTLYTGGSDGFVSSTAAPIASGWSEPSSRGRDRAEARALCHKRQSHVSSGPPAIPESRISRFRF